MLEQNSTVTVNIAGASYGTWTTKSGGQVEAEDTKFKPGGMQPEISLGGVASVENVTISKLYDATMRSKFHTLAALVGKATMSVAYQPLDADGNPSGRAIVYSGRLIRVTPPDSDASSNDAAMIEVEMSSAGSIA